MTSLYYAPGKADARIKAVPELRASGDRLFVVVANAMIASECFTVPALDYITRKRLALKASYFRQRYGRDYATGAPRHKRQRDAWWNEGYQDIVDGRPLCRQPAAWSRRRWVAYCLGAEQARAEA